MRYIIFSLVALMMWSGQLAARGTYQTPQDFLAEVFVQQVPKPQKLWIVKDLKLLVKKILGHRLPSLRLRYWREDQKTVWILEEVGKEEVITVGIVVNDNKIERLKVLIFRESRGWEVRHAFFTDQFKQATLQDDLKLDRHIDGISGATLSVRALHKLARLALLFHQRVVK